MLDIVLITLILLGGAIAASGALVLLALRVFLRACTRATRSAVDFFKARK